MVGGGDPVRSRLDWHGAACVSGDNYHSCWRAPSPDDARSGEKHRVGNVAVLVLLTVGSYALDFLSGYFGARYFGATKWGMFGALLGALIGIFFGLAGLFVGPVIGAVAGEFIAGKRMIDAGRAGWGSLLGNLGAMMGKLFIALVMITIFFLTRAISALKLLR